MPQGRRTTNLDLSSIVLELIGIKDMGGGARKTVRIALVDLLAWLESAYGAVAARAASDAAQAIGLANNARVSVKRFAAQSAQASADAARAIGIATANAARIRQMSAAVAQAASTSARALGAATDALTRIRLLAASVARVDANSARALGLANNVSNRVSHLDDVQIVLRNQVFG